ncbi:Calcium-transporting ATPase [Quillaja saponaria]|uniref:P-type Ca(2+) transporter n=1 Tax=Quillaja saponaria TaxID=32244 RepID=A0AAD7KPL7_QUISA|nr:Calcium-transporting ATPase [Quillaja saponaria]
MMMPTLRSRKPNHQDPKLNDEDDNPLSKSETSKRRWRSIFNAIAFNKLLIDSLTEKVLKNKTRNPNLLPSRSYVAIDVQPIEEESLRDSPEKFANFDAKSLSDMVRDKNSESLSQFGGVQGLAATLQTDLKCGIGSNQAEMDPFKDTTIIILLICAVLSLGFGIKQHGLKEGWYDGGSIIVAIFLVVAVSAVSNFKQARQFDKLSAKSSDIRVEVVRDARRQPISIFDVVVGDVVCLKIGDQIPADGLFIEGHSLKIDESSMNGESDHVEINVSTNPFLLSGTKVTDGFGLMLVTSVGMNTGWGKMMSLISRDLDEQTPLQERLNKLTSCIGMVGLAVAAIVLVVMLIRYFTGNTTDDKGNQEFNGKKTKVDDIMNAVVDIVAAAVTIVVVAIPEGLPLAVTLTLAFSMKRMMRDNAYGKEVIGEGIYSEIAPNVRRLLQEAVGLNTTGSVYKPNPSSPPEVSGSPTEKAILSWAALDLDMNVDAVKQSYDVIQVEAFNSEKKRSGVLMKEKSEAAIHTHWKGAAEMILAICSNYYDRDGTMRAMDGEERIEIETVIKDMAAKSLRCIAFAHNPRGQEDGQVNDKLEETGLTLLGLVGLKDPCRPGVESAVQSCRSAGVKIKMITGDNVHTAKAIAFECGILNPHEELDEEAIIEGVEFRNYTHEVRMNKIDKIRVMARSSPFDKNLMVQCLKEKGHVVAVTGDGTNDAPALKEADIGLSMGIQGTEVAKESSDIVILDDNFSSVVTVLRWGRCVYNNIQKFIQFQLTVNVACPCHQLRGSGFFRKLEKKNIFEGLHKNKLFLAIVSITIALQVVMVEFLKKFANTERLDWSQWGVCIGFAAVSWPIGILVKFIKVSNKH